MEELSLVDAHAHLDELSDVTEALQEARHQGISAIVAVGVNLDSNIRTLKIARENPNYVYPALGIHPWNIEEKEVERSLTFIRDHSDQCVALGEIGLDYKVKIKKNLQWKVFGALLDLADELDKPVIIHCRFSHHHALKMAKERGIERAVFHWYSGPEDVLDELLSAGYSISATPALCYSPPHQAAVKRAPLERILLETDTPVSYQGKEARPKDVHVSLREVARLKNADIPAVAKQTALNTSRLFRIPFWAAGVDLPQEMI